MTLTRRIAQLEARTRPAAAQVRIVILEDGEETPAAQEGEWLIVIAPFPAAKVRGDDHGDA
jgi:hypothetical protein